MGEKYTIIAGPVSRPETVEVGVLEKGSGQTVISGATAKAMHKRADIGFPNYTEAWGVRVISDSKIPDERIDVSDTRYKGQIKPLKWGDPKGYLIPCRYLRGYNTLDQQYQDIILKVKDTIREDTEASADAFFLRVQSGDNVYDPETDPYLVLMLRIHCMNENSVSKSPEAQNFMYREATEGQKAEKETKVFTAKFEALKVVNEAAQDNSLQRLKNLYQIVSSIVDQEVKDNDLYRYLSILADTKPDAFLGQINEWKKNVSNTFEKLKSYSAIDLEKDGHIVAGQTKKELVGEDVPGKKEAMLDWVLVNYTDAKAFEITFKLKQIADKLK